MPSETKKKKEKSQATSGLVQSSWFEGFCDYLTRNDFHRDHQKLINEAKYTVRDGAFTYRIINYWSSEGLLPERRQKGSEEWRRLSMKDTVWMQIVVTMRNFGFPISKIRKTYECLMVDAKGNILNKIDAAILACFYNPPLALFVVILEDGTADVADLHSIDSSDHQYGYQHFIRINVNEVVGRFFRNLAQPKAPSIRMNKEEFSFLYEHSNQDLLPNAEEAAILHALKQEKVDGVNVKKRNGRIKDVEITSFENKDPNVFATLNNMDFGELTVKVERGKPVFMAAKTTKRIIDEDNPC